MIRKLFIISLGGSLIIPKKIDAKFLKAFHSLIIGQIKKGGRFIISPGGGKTCRNYQEALKKIVRPSAEDLDWIGLYTNNFHAKLLRLIFKDFTEAKIVNDPNKKILFNKPILIGSGGWKPGRSSDDFSVRLAKIYQATTVINLSNIDFVYDKDPRKFKTAKKIKSISWNDFFKIIGTKWRPGENVPFDPVAGKFAQRHKLKVIITNGKDLTNLKNILNNKASQGTMIF
jgi:uridylate kinase